MTIGNTKEALAERSVLREGDELISERAYNLIIGGVLLWGFVLNYLIVKLWSDNVLAFVYRNGSGAILIGYLVCAVAGAFMISAPSPVTSFLGYNLIALPIGVLLCVYLNGVDPSLVREAVVYTALITGLFMLASTVWTGFFLSMGRTLLFGLGFLIVGELVLSLIFGGFSMPYLAAGLFGMYIGYDWARCSVCATTVDNAVDAAANLYLDIINLFLRILQIMGNSKRRN